MVAECFKGTVRDIYDSITTQKNPHGGSGDTLPVKTQPKLHSRDSWRESVLLDVSLYTSCDVVQMSGRCGGRNWRSQSIDEILEVSCHIDVDLVAKNLVLTLVDFFPFLFENSPDSLILCILQLGYHIKTFHVFFCFSFSPFLPLDWLYRPEVSPDLPPRLAWEVNVWFFFFFISWSGEVLWKLSSTYLMYKSGFKKPQKNT